jgi:hypothetical protein
MNFKGVVLALGAASFVVFSALASGQQMYRCGNTYQDTPCQSGGETKRIGNASRPAGADAAARTVEGECASRGEASLKIVWAREAGATMERQLGEAKTPPQRRLIASVYQKRGSAPAIRSQIEAECQEEQDKIKQLQTLAAAAAQIKSSLPEDPVKTDPSVSQAQGGPSNTHRVTTGSSESSSHKSTCDRLSASLQTLVEQQRAGGSPAAMERMSEKKRNLEATLRVNGC